MLEQINTWTTFIFVGELVIKVLGLGVSAYAMDGMNRFDAIVVTISIVEYVLSQDTTRDLSKSHGNKSNNFLFGYQFENNTLPINNKTSAEYTLTANEVNKENMSLTIFRGFRLLRVFRLARRWRSFHKMMVKLA